MKPTLVFDIETVPDVVSGRRLLGLDGLADADVAQVMQHQRMQAKGTNFLPHHLQRVVAISVCLRRNDDFRIWTLGSADSSEADLIRRFFEGIEKYQPTLVSWNGGGFDLPVLHYRALLHGVSAPTYWDMGQFESARKWDNYLSRYQFRHTDLMDVLAMYQPRANAPLDEIAQMLGFPGKLGMDGSQVWQAFLAGEIHAIRQYCETDVMNTWLVFLRFQHMRGLLDPTQLAAELTRAREWVQTSTESHWQAFAAAWGAA